MTRHRVGGLLAAHLLATLGAWPAGDDDQAWPVLREVNRNGGSWPSVLHGDRRCPNAPTEANSRELASVAPSRLADLADRLDLGGGRWVPQRLCPCPVTAASAQHAAALEANAAHLAYLHAARTLTAEQPSVETVALAVALLADFERDELPAGAHPHVADACTQAVAALRGAVTAWRDAQPERDFAVQGAAALLRLRLVLGVRGYPGLGDFGLGDVPLPTGAVGLAAGEHLLRLSDGSRHGMETGEPAPPIHAAVLTAAEVLRAQPPRLVLLGLPPVRVSWAVGWAPPALARQYALARYPALALVDVPGQPGEPLAALRLPAPLAARLADTRGRAIDLGPTRPGDTGAHAALVVDLFERQRATGGRASPAELLTVARGILH